MFNELIKRMETISIDESELHQVFSIDDQGRSATLGDFLFQSAPESVQAEFGLDSETTTTIRHMATIRPVSTLDDEEIRPVVKSYLESIPEDEVLAIVGQGSFTAEQLRQEVDSHSDIGERITGIVRQHNAFIEEAVKEGKVQRATEEDIELPDFDF